MVSYHPRATTNIHLWQLTKAGQIKAWPKSQVPDGWEPLDAKKHKKAFPISLGQLKRGENWYILTSEAEEELKPKAQMTKLKYQTKSK